MNLMTEFIVEYKGITKYKITLTPTQTRFKIRANATKEESELVEEFARKIHEELSGKITQTYRGHFRFMNNVWQVKLHFGKGGLERTRYHCIETPFSIKIIDEVKDEDNG